MVGVKTVARVACSTERASSFPSRTSMTSLPGSGRSAIHLGQPAFSNTALPS